MLPEQGLGKIPPGQTLLLSEPIFQDPSDYQDRQRILVPKGAEEWALRVRDFDKAQTEQRLKAEYLGIVNALHDHQVPFRMILAHRDKIDPLVVIGLFSQFGIRSVEYDPSISSTCFPRDWLVDFNGQVFINPDANFHIPRHPAEQSALGEGGNVLNPVRPGNIVLAVDPEGLPASQRSIYTRSLVQIQEKYQVGFLPPPIATEIDLVRRTSQDFKSSHIDRVSAQIQNDSGANFLLADSNYLSQKSKAGNYHTLIQSECQRLGVELVDVPTTSDDTPYALNLVQFYDGFVFISPGHQYLTQLLQQIMGEEKVFTVKIPLIFYPILRRGGLRCMFLFAPEYIAGGPKLAQTITEIQSSNSVAQEAYIKVGRNESCPCGSGIKFKRCHGK